MPTPSLILVPARFKTGKLYTPVATTSGGLVLGASGDFNVTRATTATRVNASGNIEVVASGIPRLDYFASGGVVGCPALLVEPSAQNSILQSEAWNTSPWAATSGSQGATVSGNVTASPDGTTNADKLIEAAVTGTHFCLQSLTLTSGTTYTASCFVKASERTRGRLRTSGSSAYWDLDFNLTSGTVTGGTNPFIQNYGNGWYRIGATFTANQASNNFILFLLDASGNASYTGNGTNGLFVYGAQIEVGSVATSYIPTTTAPITRNADVINVTGAVSGCIGQTEGTIYWDIAYVGGVLTGTGNPEFGVRNQALTNWIGLTSNGPSSPFRITARTTGGVSLINYQANIASGKAALAWSSAGLVLYVNGVSVATSATNPNFSFSRADIGNTSTMPFKANAFALYTTRLINAELAALTTL